MKGYSITDACIGCGLCARNCPEKAISGKPKEKYIIDGDACCRCGLCGRLCPRGAVLDEDGVAVEKEKKGERKNPHIDTAICAGCSICVEECPAGCLSLSEPEFRGDIRTVAFLRDQKKCIGCGLCAAYCPINAITMSGPEFIQDSPSGRG